jgi:hypothetical protein
MKNPCSPSKKPTHPISKPRRGHRWTDRRPGLQALRADKSGDQDCGRDLRLDDFLAAVPLQAIHLHV